MRIPVQYAVRREELTRDPFAKVTETPETVKGKGILAPDELGRLIAAPIADIRVKAAILLAALCGLRRGEIRGLRWEDVDAAAGILHVVHNFVNAEGSKAPKCGSARTVPLPEAVRIALEAIHAIASFDAPEDFALASLESRKRPPVSIAFFQYGFPHAPESIGITREDQERRNRTFHGLRHT
ncbi:MAG: tyrosine-type recombinase/integrase [Rectinemataceae bacterium]|jgi:integrase